MECWKRAGSPTVVNGKVLKAIDLIGDVYEHHGAGGALHVLIDDFNFDSIEFCEAWIDNRGRENPTLRWLPADEPSVEQVKAERACVAALKDMTLDERASAIARYHYPEHFS